LYPDSTYTYH